MRFQLLFLAFLFSKSFQSNAQFGIQTNIIGYTALPLLFPKHTSYEFGFESHVYKRFVLKTSVYYLNKTDTIIKSRKLTREDHLQKYGVRISIKQYTEHNIKKNEIPQGFYVGGYNDFMIGKRDVYIDNDNINSIEHRKGSYLSIGCNVGYTYCTGHFALEPNIGIGVSFVSNSLVNQDGWFNFDPEEQSLSTCHFQLNLGYRF